MGKHKVKIGISIVIIIILFLLLRSCGNSRLGQAVRSPEQSILQQMKEEENLFISLLQRSDICSEEWIEELILLSEKIQNYSYAGTNPEIIQLIQLYKEYGKELEAVGKTMQEKEYEQAKEKLLQIEEMAVIIESELNNLYEEHYQEK